MVSLAEGRSGGNGVYTFVTPPSEPLDAEHTDSGPVLLGSGEQVPLVTGTDRNFTMNSLESSNILVPFRETQLHWTVVLNGIAYLVYLVLMSVLPFTLDNGYNYHSQQCKGTSPTPDGYLAFFAMAHVALTGATWLLYRLQLHGLGKLEGRGYAKFCQNQRRFLQVPVTTANAANSFLVVFMSSLYFKQINLCSWVTEGSSFRPGYILFILVPMETLVSCTFLLTFVVRCVHFNVEKPAPDVLQDMMDRTQPTTQAPPTVGFREGTDVDSLLERQADTIRYLQQHNATLANRILLLQQERTSH